MKKPKNVDEYITSYPKNTQKLLKEMRAIIKKSAPLAEEVISYGMPAYKYHGMLAYFAAHANHIGLYPMPSGIVKFHRELATYIPPKTKSTIQFPFGKKLPTNLITKVIKWRMKENEQKAGILSALDISQPAHRALQNAGITTIKKLSNWKEKEIRKLHGMGPSTIPKLKSILKSKGLSWERDN